MRGVWKCPCLASVRGLKVKDAVPSSTNEQNKLRIVSWTKGIMIIELIDFAQKFNYFTWKIFWCKILSSFWSWYFYVDWKSFHENRSFWKTAWSSRWFWNEIRFLEGFVMLIRNTIFLVKLLTMTRINFSLVVHT